MGYVVRSVIRNYLTSIQQHMHILYLDVVVGYLLALVLVPVPVLDDKSERWGAIMSIPSIGEG